MQPKTRIKLLESDKIISAIETKSGVLVVTEKSAYRLYDGVFYAIPFEKVDG